MESYHITALHIESGQALPLVIEADEGETTERIVLSAAVEGDVVTAGDYGYFQAFQRLRDHLLMRGYGLKCAGACLNAVQSAMAGGTDKVYLISQGKQALKEDQASIYDYAERSVFPDTGEQNAFCQEWLESLRRP